MNATCKRFGFSLLEIMIAVLIISMLTALALPRFLKSRDEAKISQARADLEILSTAVEQLAWDTKMWPGALTRTDGGSAETWDLSTAEAGILSATADFKNWRGPYVHRLPEVDPWGQKYFFDPDYPINGTDRAVVGSFGPNGVGPNQYDTDDICIAVDRP